MQHRYSRFLILLITVTNLAFSTNELKIVWRSSNALDVQFANSDKVTGVQFSVHISSGISLQSITQGSRTMKSSWIFDSYIANDTTVNIVVLNMNQESYPAGTGTLASIFFTVDDKHEVYSIDLTNVLAINEHGDSLGVTITNLVWMDKNFSAMNTDESKTFILEQNHPNPFNPSTRITYHLKTDAHVRLSVYNITGREVIRLVDQFQYKGDYHVTWKSDPNNGQKMASGMYIARLNVGNSYASRKMLLTK